MTELYIPKPGERVRVVEVSREDPCPMHRLGDVATVRKALVSIVGGYIMLCEAGVGWTWCRVEPVVCTCPHDAKLTAVRVALTEAGVPEVEPYPEEDVSDHEKSLRAGGRVIGAVARIERLVARLTAAGDVVKMARQLVSYDWEARLDDSKTSDAAKHDARELSYAVYEYDRAAKS